MENMMQPKQVAWPIPHQDMPSFHSTPQGATEASAYCHNEEMPVHEFEPTSITSEEDSLHEILKGLVDRDVEYLDVSRISAAFTNFKYVDPNDSVNTNILDNSNFGLGDSYEQLSPTLQQIQYTELLVKETTAIDIDTNLRPDDGVIGIQANQIKEAQHIFTPSSFPTINVIQSTVCSQESIQRTEMRDEKPFSCEICNKSFRRKDGLLQHAIVHSDKKPYLCKVCDKSFRRKSELLTHSYIHTGKKLFVCQICNKAFAQRGTLTNHSSIHAGERPRR